MTDTIVPQGENPSASSAGPVRRRRSWRLGCGLLVLLVLLAAIPLGLKAARMATAGRSALDDLRALQGLDLSSLSSLDPAKMAEMRDRFAGLETSLATIEHEAAPALPLASHLGWLPRFSAEAQAAPQLLPLARGAATAGRAAMDGALPVLDAYKQPGEGSALQRIVPALEAAGPRWQETKAALDQVATARAGLDLSAMDPRIAGQIQRLDQYLPLLDAGASLAQVAPALLGADGPRKYLLLAQNSDELRPTGGFITGVGLLEVNRGELGEMDFKDSYTVYSSTVDHPLAPPDLEHYMGAQMLLFRDANWTPDYPAAAAVAQALYQLDTGVSTDGVIAFDLEAVRRIVEALQPLSLPGYQEPVTADNMMIAMRQVWAEPSNTQSTLQERNSDWWRHRKDFMGDLAAAARAKVESGQVDFGKLAQAVYSSLREKHILLRLDDPDAMTTIAALGWDGSVRPDAGDYLMVVDSNVGWNKVNGLVDRATVYQVAPKADGGGQAELELTYRHRGEALQTPCLHEVRYGDAYEDMLRRCYFDYVRVYAPEGARLLSADGFEPDSMATLPGDRGSTVFAGYLVVPSGETRQVHLSYELPAEAIGGDRYRLRIQKQAGTPGWPVSVAFDDPSGVWTPVPADASVLQATGATTYTLPLWTDVDLEFTKQ